ncbi:MAG: TauD/TfdA family dioxygenase [Gammaproteobacteria bacterium]
MNPFDLDNDRDYLLWREQKLEDYPQTLEELVVEVKDPRNLTAAEYQAMHRICQKTNMVLYASSVTGADKDIPRMLGAQFGLNRINRNWLADEDAITSLTVNPAGDHPQYIPYTNRAIKWHTDGYYNKPDEQIHGLLLHCVQPASEGGENQLIDHEIAYILLRDENPEYIRQLMKPDAMTIPPRQDAEGKEKRLAVTGPVFSVAGKSGDLHMRYTARTRSILWQQDAALLTAVAALEALLEADLPWKYKGLLEAGMGLVSNNVLHDRSGFKDNNNSSRLLYRARYFDRIQHTSRDEI